MTDDYFLPYVYKNTLFRNKLYVNTVKYTRLKEALIKDVRCWGFTTLPNFSVLFCFLP